MLVVLDGGDGASGDGASGDGASGDGGSGARQWWLRSCPGRSRPVCLLPHPPSSPSNLQLSETLKINFLIILFSSATHSDSTLSEEILRIFLYALYSTLLHLPPLRFHCVGGCWD